MNKTKPQKSKITKDKNKDQDSPISENSYVELIIPAKDGDLAIQKAVVKLSRTLKIAGFRKGKVPAAIAKSHLNQQELIDKAVQSIFYQYYQQALQKEDKKPITQPKISIISLNEGEDWHLKVEFAEKPEVSIKNYQTIIQKTKKSFKKTDSKKEKLFQIYQALIRELKPQIPELLLKQEVDYDLQVLYYQLQSMGKNLSDYLKETGQNQEEFATFISASALGRIQLNYIIQRIVEQEEIKVDNKEVQKKLDQKPAQTDADQTQNHSHNHQQEQQHTKEHNHQSDRYKQSHNHHHDHQDHHHDHQDHHHDHHSHNHDHGAEQNYLKKKLSEEIMREKINEFLLAI